MCSSEKCEVFEHNMISSIAQKSTWVVIIVILTIAILSIVANDNKYVVSKVL